jgi:capsular polysaccharide biosynthesis protein
MQKDPHDTIQGSLNALWQSFFFILGASIIIGILAYGITKNIPGAYEVHFSYMVSLDQKDTTPGFRYDGFYAISAVDLFSSTLASIADSPETVVAAYKKANMALPTQDAIRLVRTVRSEKSAPQLVRITVKDASKKNAEQLASALMFVVNSAIDEYNTKGLSSITFHGVSTEPWTSMNEVAPLPVAATFFMVMFLGGNMLVLFREALRRGAS